ncbi:MAG: transglutaminase family protein [Pseudomonadota bacterium]
MIYRLRHRTTYHYGGSVTRSDHRMWLHPRVTPFQSVERFELETAPGAGTLKAEVDYFGNPSHLMSIEEAHETLWVEARSRVEVLPAPDPIGFDTVAAVREAVQRADISEAAEAAEFAFPTFYTAANDALEAMARETFTDDKSLIEAARTLTSRIFTEFDYDPSATDAATPAIEAFEKQKGVCQDFAHVFLACCRAVGLPARYVSGYLLTRPPEGQEKLIGSDASHAWLSVWAPNAGWVDFDPTNDLIPRDEHITTAWGRDFADVSPIRGIVLGGGGGHGIDVAVDVIPD